ncbi:Stf0 family sulfotransferase [Methylocucumis oryzae]|uniref:Sulphotransferase Stf0 domain-containing protein n=1 Tax=Methylocucumis oryzae TaxID=1632867 RepID=A0A0F3IFH0_9GAMM|nr:Stf0 family sulfotransferase [Methylocucumis oryzae]KJV05511.1 hypothetical protein VZ94_17690 [Methylocucumis oryzae]
MSENLFLSIFNDATPNLNRLDELSAFEEPRKKFILAMTPRSGSTYLCDRMKATKRLGQPEELLGQLSLKKYLRQIPARNADEYLKNAMRIKRTANNVASLKTSWFQFEKYLEAMQERGYLNEFKYIYLTRRDLIAQAISLYRATASAVFHTDKQQKSENLALYHTLEYDYVAIKHWFNHIVAQEKRLASLLFSIKKIFPLCVYYEDIEEDLLTVLKRIALFVSVHPENIVLPEEPSLFKKT